MFYASPLFLKTLSNIDSMIYDIINDDISDENIVNTLNESHATFWNNHDETHDYHRSISVYVSCINQVLGSNNCVDYIWDKKTAKKFELESVNEYQPVHVAAIWGDPGTGKSSYLRMIIESFNPAEVLYTYVSLTEVNEEKGFSKLFADRWISTISLSRFLEIRVS